MTGTRRRSAAFTALALSGALVFTGCSSAEEPPEDETVETPQEEPEETEVGTGDTPEWFEGSLDAGVQIGEGSTDSWDIKVFQVGTGETDSDSMFVDPETNENVLPEGSEIVFLNFVYTNTSDEAFPLAMIPEPSVRSVNWPYAQGQPGTSRAELYEEHGISSTGYDVTKIDEVGDPYVVEPGQSIAIATSIEYEPGVDAVAKPRFTPKDENGDLVHDDTEEAEITVTIE